jgi:hypothetical protein
MLRELLGNGFLVHRPRPCSWLPPVSHVAYPLGTRMLRALLGNELLIPRPRPLAFRTTKAGPLTAVIPRGATRALGHFPALTEADSDPVHPYRVGPFCVRHLTEQYLDVATLRSNSLRQSGQRPIPNLGSSFGSATGIAQSPSNESECHLLKLYYCRDAVAR